MSLKNFFKELKETVVQKFSIIFWFGFSAVMFWILIQLLYLFYGFSTVDWIKGLPFVYPTFLYIYSEIMSNSAAGMLYLFSLSSLFFFPIPLETLFFKFSADTNVYFIFVYATIGIYIGQIVNYILGRYLGFIFRHFVNRRNQKKLKQKLFRYGGTAIIVMEALPLPFQLFNFFTGVFKYSFSKFLIFSLIGLVIKNLILLVIYVKFFG